MNNEQENTTASVDFNLNDLSDSQKVVVLLKWVKKLEQDKLDLSRAHAAEREKSPRIYTRCPACHNDTLTINYDKHLLCTFIGCPDPTLIDRISVEREKDRARIAEPESRVWNAISDPQTKAALSLPEDNGLLEEVRNAIEHANELVKKMSDGKGHIRFEKLLSKLGGRP